MKGIFNNVTVKGIQAVAPVDYVNNMDFIDYLGLRRCKKQIKLTGVEKRHVSVYPQITTDLAYIAARELLTKISWKPEEVNVVVFLTQSPKFWLPSTAFFLQHALGLSKACVCFDVNLGCTAALEGIQIVSSLLQQCEGVGKGLVLVADTANKINPQSVEPDVLADLMLFGGAGVAMAIEKNDAFPNKIFFSNYSDGNRYNALIKCNYNSPVQMDGTAIFDFGVNEVTKGLVEFKEAFNISEEQVDIYSFHQAQKLMLDTMIASCNIPEEKEIRSLMEYGNTAGSSVIMNYCHNYEKLKKRNTFNTIMCGFGVGLSWTYMYMQLNSDCIFPVILSDEHYEE